MLQIKEISKKYVTGELEQLALNKVSLNLRDNEFVAILGPSGSGKTTLLNIIGGLDRYDEGDLVINNISTKKYKDRDWDSYRNHTIGFVFQSYNLIPHQTVLANVELALTISGISRSERRKRAKEALEKVGLGEQIHKKPNQMSGGQMQRVAIARALVNNPDILLADEPTGALDTETSVQVMDLLKEVAKDRLVVMVTHNPELAQQYATRIVKLRDGVITDDSNPYEMEEEKQEKAIHKNMGKSSMSFLTALALSFNNLWTKKGRTFLTAFAGSIGIIGIALILSLSTGVNQYITDIQRSTMTSYPITINAHTIDLSSMVQTGGGRKKEVEHDFEGIYTNVFNFEMASAMTTSITKNNLTEFKKYLEDPNSEIHQYIGENGVVYSYDTKFDVYTYDPDGVFMNTDGSILTGNNTNPMMNMMGSELSSMMPTRTNFGELTPGRDGELLAPAVYDNYELVYGKWPENYDEVVLIMDKNHEILAMSLYEIGMLPSAEYKDYTKKILQGEEIDIQSVHFTYEDICKQEFYVIPACDTFVKQANGNFKCVKDDNIQMEKLAKDAVKLKIVGVIMSDNETNGASEIGIIGYTKALSDYIIEHTDESEIVKAQLASKDTSVLNGMTFSPSDDAAKIADCKAYLTNAGISEKANIAKSILPMIYAQNPEMLEQVSMMSETDLAYSLDAMMADSQMQDSMLLGIYDNYISAGTYEDNMSAFGVVSLDAPKAINIYADSFEAKDYISDCIQNYNDSATEENQITYTDYVGLLMSSVTTIINVISYVLMAFVAVSLIVSSIMIGIITYISVLERTKEIGILRAIGASKHNISQVFNAETFIIGLCSGLIGIGVTLLLLIPINSLIHAIADNQDVNAILPMGGALVLIVLSMVLTMIGGLIPSKKAAKKDPVTALHTE